MQIWLSEPEFYGDLVYKKIVGSINFSAQFIKVMSHYKKKRLAITLMYCNRLHAWWSTQSRLTTLLSSLIARRLICLHGVSWWLSGSSSRCHGVVCGLWLWYFLIILTYNFRLYDGSDFNWWDGRGLMLWLFVGPTRVYLLDFFCSGIPFYFLLIPFFALSPFYILIYMFWEMMQR